MESRILQPWVENPFRLISWLEMNEFAAASYLELTNLLERMNEVAAAGWSQLKTVLQTVERNLRQIGCQQSAEQAVRIIQMLDSPPVNADAISHRCLVLNESIRTEMKSHLFFWVPSGRASFHGQKARDILGEKCVANFPKSGISNEAEQAVKCFAFGQYTACAFHLMRISEAGVLALGKAAGHNWGKNHNWGGFFKWFDANPPTGKHQDFLQVAKGNLSAVKDAWRNRTMHLEKVYDEEQARHLLVVIPSMMKHLASKIDEDGQFV